MEEHLKKIIDLALLAGEKRISPQTDYIHLKYHALQEDVHYTIPVVENFLFVLALFRTRSVENITRGKAIIEKLLFFQEKSGNFPVYLHEFPECKDHHLAVQLIAPIYWIYQGFHQILGSELKNRLEKALCQIITYCLHFSSNKNLPDNIRIRIATGAYATGKLLHLNDFEKEGERRLAEFKRLTEDAFQPKYLADLMISSQLYNPLLSQSFIPGFWTHLCRMWHEELCSYRGPKVMELQACFEPEVTLYDLFMGYFTKKFSKRALKDDPVHLQGALIQQSSDQIESTNFLEKIETVGDLSFAYFQDEKYSVAFCEQNRLLNPAIDKGFSPFKLIFGSPQRLHTFVLEGGNSEKITFSRRGHLLEFFFHLSDVPELEDKEKSREICFYFDLFEKSGITIDGLKATTFNVGEKVLIDIDGFNLTLKFEILQGEGQFLGHFMRGNRPSQIANKGSQRFQAYDSQIFLRTIRRDKNAVIKAVLELN